MSECFVLYCILQHLVALHNEVAQAATAAAAVHSKSVANSSSSMLVDDTDTAPSTATPTAAAVTSSQLTAAQAISIDIDGQFVPYLAQRCGFDFAKAEARLLSTLTATAGATGATAVPTVTLEPLQFAFAGELHLTGSLASLRTKVCTW
jgi:hypothetical protein